MQPGRVDGQIRTRGGLFFCAAGGMCASPDKVQIQKKGPLSVGKEYTTNPPTMSLLVVTALLEAVIGVALIGSPAQVVLLRSRRADYQAAPHSLNQTVKQLQNINTGNRRAAASEEAEGASAAEAARWWRR